MELTNNMPDMMPSEAMWFVIATAIVWLAYEIYVLYYRKETISVGIYKIARAHPIVVLFIGILLGHWFW